MIAHKDGRNFTPGRNPPPPVRCGRLERLGDHELTWMVKGSLRLVGRCRTAIRSTSYELVKGERVILEVLTYEVHAIVGRDVNTYILAATLLHEMFWRPEFHARPQRQAPE